MSGVGGVGECEGFEGYGAGVGEAKGAGMFVGRAKGELGEAEKRGGCCAGGGDLRDQADDRGSGFKTEEEHGHYCEDGLDGVGV